MRRITRSVSSVQSMLIDHRLILSSQLSLKCSVRNKWCIWPNYAINHGSLDDGDSCALWDRINDFRSDNPPSLTSRKHRMLSAEYSNRPADTHLIAIATSQTSVHPPEDNAVTRVNLDPVTMPCPFEVGKLATAVRQKLLHIWPLYIICCAQWDCTGWRKFGAFTISR